MARPKKDNADYFPHEADMRNDDRIKALRKRFKLNGYAIWNMLLEYIAKREHFKFEYTDLTLELIAGDFDADKTEIQEVISYCLTLGLLQQIGTFIQCKRLEKGLEPLLSKRKRDRKEVIASENPQSKVKKSKGEIFTKIGEGSLFISVKAKYAGEKPKRIYQMDKFFELTDQLQALQDAKLTRFTDFINANPGRVYNDDDHVYSSFKKFCIDSPDPKSRAPARPYEDAELNRKQWTEDAWRNQYAKQIKSDEAFRKHFNITIQ